MGTQINPNDMAEFALNFDGSILVCSPDTLEAAGGQTSAVQRGHWNVQIDWTKAKTIECVLWTGDAPNAKTEWQRLGMVGTGDLTLCVVKHSVLKLDETKRHALSRQIKDSVIGERISQFEEGFAFDVGANGYFIVSARKHGNAITGLQIKPLPTFR